ncbi:glycosyltransferase family 32 protein [Paracoccus sanguinis]|uniref:glycosyltransferase family 32 protein n=1 Tax=Paracoccus sanguinis TaxID=1545044 RepID=UPI0006908DAF|nr:glycosyltransferase [Paracoccus sanguinis]
MLPSLFTLETHWRTLLSVTPQGLLTHAPPDEVAPAIFSLREGRLVAWRPDATGDSPVYLDLEAATRTEGRIALRGPEGLFATAEPHGAVSVSRGRARAWELYRPAAAAELLARPRPLTTPRWAPSAEIPRLIHQVYLGPEVPAQLGAMAQSLAARNPDHVHRLWRDDTATDLIRDAYGMDMLRQYERISPAYGAARADFFRYLCLYRLGGVYLDMKSDCRRPLSEVVPHDAGYLLSHWTGRLARFGGHDALAHLPGGELQQWHVIAAAGHPFLEAVINAVLRNIDSYVPERHGGGQRAVLRLAGPIAYTLAIAPLRDAHPHRLIDAEAEGFVYRAVRAARKLSGTHYSEVRTPLIVG